MANTKITELTALTQCAATDVLPIVKVSANTTKKVSISDLLRNAPAGTAAAPGIANADDQDTGILFPAANSIGVSTGGAQRLVIDSSGNVGIGDSSPSNKLVVKDGGSPTIEINGQGRAASLTLGVTASESKLFEGSNNALAFGTNNTERLRIDNSGRLLTNTTTVLESSSAAKLHIAHTSGALIALGRNDSAVSAGNDMGKIAFYGNDGGSYEKVGQITCEADGSHASGDKPGRLIFQTTADSASSPTERMRIDSSGKVGIGTTSPTNVRLDIKEPVSSTAGTGHLGFSGGSTPLWVWRLSDSAADLYLDRYSGGWSTTPSLTIKRDTGNVGIGTTSPSTSLDVSGAISLGSVAIPSAGTARIYSRNTDNNLYLQTGSGDTINFLDGSQNTLASFGDTALVFNTGNTERMRIDSSGRVAIGQSTANDKLHVAGNIRAAHDAGGRLVLEDSNQADSSTPFYLFASTGGVLTFTSANRNGTGGTTGSTERMRIDSSGRVLIGTTTEGDVNADDLTIANSGNCGMTIRSGASNSGSIFFSDGTSGVAEYQGQILYDHNSNYMRFTTGASERARIDSSGNVLVGKTTTALTTVGTRIDVGSVDCSASSSSTNLGTNSGGSIRIANTNSTDNNFSNIGGYNSNGLVVNQINFINTSHSSRTGEIGFSTHNGSVLTERMRIDSAGNVGIGTTSPSNNLDILSTTSGATVSARVGSTATSGVNNANLIINNGGTGNATLRFDYESSANRASIGVPQSTQALFFTTAGSERMRIDSSGRLLVGTSSNSGANLFVAGGSGQSVGTEVDIARFFASTASSTNSGGLTIGGVWHNTDVNQRIAYLQSEQGNNPGSTARHLALNPGGGNVGIGTKSPDYNLTIGDGSSYVIQNLKAATNEFCEFRFGDTSSVAQGKITYDNGTDSLRVAVNASERMRIDSSGRVGIGVSTMSGGAGDVTIIRNSALRWADSDGTQRADIYGDSNSNIVFRNGTSSTERMRIASSGLSDIFGTSSVMRLRTGLTGTSGQLLGGFNGATSISNGTQSLAIFANGNIQNTNNSYGSLSDSKLKENIVDANSQWDDIKDIRVRNYNFIEGETHTQLGVVAQEIETVSPGLVTDSPDLDEEGNDLGTVTKSVNYSVLYMKAVKALQEAMDRIETLETKVAALEAQ